MSNFPLTLPARRPLLADGEAYVIKGAGIDLKNHNKMDIWGTFPDTGHSVTWKSLSAIAGRLLYAALLRS
jgi:hypothetical protein